MEPVSYSFSSRDNLKLFARAWISPTTDPRGIVFLVHGHGEHTGRYDHIGKALVASGYHLAGFDLRGHGLSEGRRGHAPGLSRLIEDIQLFISETRRHFDTHLPVFLYGHSMGGNLVIHFGLQHPNGLKGAIVSSPAFSTSQVQHKVKIALVKFLARLMPIFSINSGLETEALSRNTAIVKAYEKDVYVHEKISARLAAELLESGQIALKKAPQWELPLLLMHGTADRITSCASTEAFADRVEAPLKLVLWDGFFHELHHDLGFENVIQTMVEWLDQNAS